MHEHAQLITTFYDAFAKRDAEGMAACYHPDVTFQDPVFTLKGDAAGDMWRMLCERGKDLVITPSGIEADDNGGRAHWDAEYSFQGRPVLNRIDAAFTFKDGRIVSHVDTFDFHTWASQALGLPGKMLGRFGFFRNTVAKKANADLDRWRTKNRGA